MSELNLQIVILVRDPRARYKSMKHVGEFGKAKKVFDTMCPLIESDIQLTKELPKGR